MLTRETFNGPHVWHTKSTLLQNTQKDRLAIRETGNVKCERFLRESTRQSYVSPFTSHLSRFLRVRRERRIGKGAPRRAGAGRVRRAAFPGSCYDFFLPAEGEGTGEFSCGAAVAGAVEAGVDSCDFLASMILVRIVASLVKGEFG
jgi:hypothetical protein